MAVRRASDSGPQFCGDDGDGRGASPAVVAQKSFDDSLVRLHQRCWPMLSTQRASSRRAGKIADPKKNGSHRCEPLRYLVLAAGLEPATP